MNNKLHTKKFKKKAVKVALTSDEPLYQTAQTFNISRNKLVKWINKYHFKVMDYKKANAEKLAKIRKKEDQRTSAIADFYDEGLQGIESINTSNLTTNENQSLVPVNLDVLIKFDEDSQPTNQIFQVPYTDDKKRMKNIIIRQSRDLVAMHHIQWSFSEYANLLSNDDELSDALFELFRDEKKHRKFVKYVEKQEGEYDHIEALPRISNYHFPLNHNEINDQENNHE